MKISLEWLRDYVEIRETPEQLKDDLTMVGLVVESISLLSKIGRASCRERV